MLIEGRVRDEKAEFCFGMCEDRVLSRPRRMEKFVLGGEMGLYLRGVAPFPSPSALNTLDGKLYHEDFNGCARPRAPSRLHPNVFSRGRSRLHP